MADHNKFEQQRSFERYLLDFPVEISGVSQSGAVFSDRGVLSNISGNGLCFSTGHVDWYAMGQQLTVHVCLPATDKMNACMATTARVVWVQAGQAEAGDASDTLIGIAMEGCMAFETMHSSPPEHPQS